VSVTLSVASFLTAVGFVAWLVGETLNYQGIAVIGATLVVGLGAAITTGGLQYQTGETTTGGCCGDTTTAAEYQTYEPPASLPFGPLVMILGAVMALRPLNTL